MYSKGKRNLDFSFKSPSKDHVGPGCYKPKPIKDFAQKDAYAPFGSLNTRDRGSLYDEVTKKQPRPDMLRYNVVSYEAGPTVGGSSLANRSTRFGAASTNVPDPGAYNVGGTIGKKYGRSLVPNRPKAKFTRKANAAAIPSRTEVNGYEEDPRTGELRKAFTDESSTMDLGPGSHDIPHPEDKRSVYNGANFGKRTSNRVLKTTMTQEGPAPGAYEPISALKMTTYLPMRRAPTSVVARSKRDMDPQGEAVAVPAANSYNIPSCFTQQAKPTAVSKFGSTTERFEEADSVKKRLQTQPGPGTFNAAKEKAANPHYTIQADPVKKPFNQSAARFAQEPNNKKAPGPNGYNVESWHAGHAGVKVSVDSKLNVAARGGFGSVVERKDPFEDKVRQKIAPAPGAYNMGGRYDGKLKAKSSSQFKSVTPQRPKAQNLDKPRPTEYNVVESHDAINNKSMHRGDDLKPFNTQQGRFDPSTSTQRQKLAVYDNPAPSAYRATKPTSHVAASRFEAPARFRSMEPENPAPTKYHLHESVQSSTYKPTFNATLQK